MASTSQKAATPGSHSETMIFMLLMMKSMKNERKDTPKSSTNYRCAKTPAAQNMPHEEEHDDNNYESIEETAI